MQGVERLLGINQVLHHDCPARRRRVLGQAHHARVEADERQQVEVMGERLRACVRVCGACGVSGWQARRQDFLLIFFVFYRVDIKKKFCLGVISYY